MREALHIRRRRDYMTGPVKDLGLLTAAILAGRAKTAHDALRDDVRDFQTHLDAMEKVAESRVSTDPRAAFLSAGLDPDAVDDWDRIVANVRFRMPKGTSQADLAAYRARASKLRARWRKVPVAPFEWPILWFANSMRERLTYLPPYPGVYFYDRVVSPGKAGLLVAHRYRMGCRDAVIRRTAIWLCAESQDGDIKIRVNNLISLADLCLPRDP